MSYIGTTPGVAFTRTLKDTFSGDDSSTTFTLQVSAATNNVEVFIENVQQEPGVSYTISNTSLIFDSAPPTGVDNVYVIHRDPAQQTARPEDLSVVTATIADNSVTNAKLANDSASFAELTLTSFNGVIKSTGGGQMYIAADSDIFLTSQDFLYTYADFRYGNGVRLFNDNVLKFMTTDSGSRVYGNLEASTLTGVYAGFDSDAAAYLVANSYATETYVTNAVNNLVDGAPGVLDTLDELAAALNDDSDFAGTVTTSLALKAPLASPALTGTPTAPTATLGTDTTQIATTAYVQTELNNIDALPDQTGNANKYLTTDGSVASWDSVQSGAIQDVFWENAQSLSANYTITANRSAVTAGPLTLDSGVTVTLDSNARWVIV